MNSSSSKISALTSKPCFEVVTMQTLGIEGYGANFGGVGCMLHHQTKRRKRCYWDLIYSSNSRNYSLFIARWLPPLWLHLRWIGCQFIGAPSPENSSFLPKEKKVGYFNAYCILSLTITNFLIMFLPIFSYINTPFLWVWIFIWANY